MKDFFKAQRPHQGFSYAAYQADWEHNLDQPLQGLDKRARRRVFYARYNKERAERVQQQYVLSERLCKAVNRITAPQLWMVLTEAWCVDSAYALPIFFEAAEQTPHVDLRILSRDENLDIMDHFLTRTARSIPKIIAFTSQGEERFRWGPRSHGAQRFREALIAQGVDGRTVSNELIAWYDAGGWQEVDEELATLLEQV